jgi:site-specific DNA recombinase
MGRDEETGAALNRAHRRQFLLSGLLVCGCCGGTYTVMAKDRYGCATRRAKGTCDNGHTIQRQRIEARILSGLKERLLTPDLVAEFIRAFEEELATLQRESADTGRRLERELAQVGRKLDGVVRAIEDGAWNDTLRQRLNDLEARKAELTTKLAQAVNPTPTVRLHPNAAEIYRAKVASLEESLNAPNIRLEASEALRSLISRIVLTPDANAPDGLAAELHGDLATILRLASERESGERRRRRAGAQNANSPEPSFSGSQLSVVAGTGFEPVTFRL